MTINKKIQQIDINISTPLWEEYHNIISSSIDIVVNICLENEFELGFPCLGDIPQQNGYSLSLTLTDDAIIANINAKWKNKKQATNILSFPTLEGQNIPVFPPDEAIPLGDMVLAFETIKKEAEDANILFMDHMNRLIIHGMFHLFGYNHITQGDYLIMMRREIEILTLVGIQKTADMGYISLD